MARPFGGRVDGSTLWPTGRRPVVAQASIALLPPTIRRPTSVGGAAWRPLEYVHRVSGSRSLARRYGFDVLIVARGARERARGRARRRRGDAPTHDALVRGAGDRRASSLPLLARRRFPFAAPAAVWLVGAALSFVDGRAGRRSTPASSSPAWPPRSCSAISATTRRRGSGWPSCSAAPAIVVYNDPAHAAGELVFIPGAVRDRLARRLRAARAVASRPRRPRSARARPSGSARRRPASRSPRSARGSRASCTTSSRTRSA